MRPKKKERGEKKDKKCNESQRAKLNMAREAKPE